MTYRQCLLSRKDEEGHDRAEVAWIPNEFAKVGKRLMIMTGDDHWVDGWVVKEAYSSADFDDTQDMRDNHKRFKWVLGR